MTGRILGFVAAMLALTVCVHAAPAGEKSVWDGVWTGNFGNGSKISVTVADNKVTNYSYRGAPLKVSYNRIADGALSFGDRENYTMSLKRTGDGAAKATYFGRHGVIAASLSKTSLNQQ
jgi:hypothetical protein